MNWPVAGWPKQTESNPELWPSWMLRTEVFTQAANGWTGEPQVNLGYRWTARKTPADNAWRAVCWSPEKRLFCAVASSGTGNRVMISPDGETWVTSPASSDSTWVAVCWARELGIFCAVSSDSPTLIMTSPDGKTWTQRASIVDATLNDVCWSPRLGLLCAVGGTATGGGIYTSPDGGTWTKRTYPWTADEITGICWSPYLNLFATVASSSSTNSISTSPDGITWTGRTGSATTGTGSKVLWLDGPNIFYRHDTSGTIVNTSSDGITWSIGAMPATGVSCMAWCKSLGRLAAGLGGGVARFRVAVSPFVGFQGTTWSQQSYPVGRAASVNLIWRGMCYSPELRRFVAVAINGTGVRVATSP